MAVNLVLAFHISRPFMRRRWIVISLGGAAFWIAFFHRVTPGTIANELQTAFAVSGAALGALAATYFKHWWAGCWTVLRAAAPIR